MSSRQKTKRASNADRKCRVYLRAQAAIVKAVLNSSDRKQLCQNTLDPKMTSAVPADGPPVQGIRQRVAVDQSTLDILVTDTDGALRRPTVTYAIDVASRMIVDFHVGFSDPAAAMPKNK